MGWASEEQAEVGVRDPHAYHISDYPAAMAAAEEAVQRAQAARQSGAAAHGANCYWGRGSLRPGRRSRRSGALCGSAGSGTVGGLHNLEAQALYATWAMCPRPRTRTELQGTGPVDRSGGRRPAGRVQELKDLSYHAVPGR